jgi:hypothetical protein
LAYDSVAVASGAANPVVRGGGRREREDIAFPLPRLHKEELMKTTWKTPTFEEIAMNAEIGSYQDDFDRPGDEGPDLIEAEASAREE